MSKKGPAIQEDITPNLIPMIDIMFLLLLFFMLGADMGQRDLEEVTLPSADAIKEDKEVPGKEKDRLTINIHHQSSGEGQCAAYAAVPRQICRNPQHWKIGIRGGDYTEADSLKKLLGEEADRYRDQANKAGASDRRIMLRADTGAPYGYIQDVMNTCAAVGIYQIECGAARRADGGKT